MKTEERLRIIHKYNLVEHKGQEHLKEELLHRLGWHYSNPHDLEILKAIYAYILILEDMVEDGMK